METLSYPTEVKAKRQHRCDFCNEKILVGETYKKSTIVSDGEAYAWKTHKHCEAIAIRLNMYEDAQDGLTQSDFMEYIDSEHADLMMKILPQNELSKYIDIIQQLRRVNFRDKLGYVIRHYNKMKP